MIKRDWKNNHTYNKGRKEGDGDRVGEGEKEGDRKTDRHSYMRV
jgi:hypothetical protein